MSKRLTDKEMEGMRLVAEGVDNYVCRTIIQLLDEIQELRRELEEEQLQALADEARAEQFQE